MNPEQPRSSRAEAGRQRAKEKARARNRAILAVTALLILAAGGALGGVFIYRKVRANRVPPLETYSVTIPEGFTVEQIAEKVEEDTEGAVTEEEFLDAARSGGYKYDFLAGTEGNLEGFLFPKTYEMTSRTTARGVVKKLLDQYGLETADLDWSRAQQLGVKPYEVLIIASLIEEEAKVAEDRPLIASVVYNRLRNNMKLGICATVQYALGEWKEELSYSDLEVDSPYNTYKIEGLPPAPICSPGFESIRAALYPAQTDFIYYILTGADGKHSFTADYNQFLRWKEEQNSKKTG